MAVSKRSLDDLPLIGGHVGMVECDRVFEGLSQGVAHVGLLRLSKLVERRGCKRQRHPSRKQAGERYSRCAVRNEDQHLLATLDQLLGHRKHQLVAILGLDVPEGFHADAAGVVLAIAILSLAEHTLAQLDGTALVHEQAGVEPFG